MAKSVRKKRNAMKVSQKVKEKKHMRRWALCVCVCVFCLLRFNTRRGFHTQWQTNLSKMTGDQVGELGHMRP